MRSTIKAKAKVVTVSEYLKNACLWGRVTLLNIVVWTVASRARTSLD